jgi:hypothetical protein
MDATEIDKMVRVTTVWSNGIGSTIFVAFNDFIPVKIKVCHTKVPIIGTENLKIGGVETDYWKMEVGVWNEGYKEWGCLLGSEAFNDQEVLEAIKERKVIGLFASRASEVFGYLEDFEDYLEYLCNSEIQEMLESKVEYDKILV